MNASTLTAAAAARTAAMKILFENIFCRLVFVLLERRMCYFVLVGVLLSMIRFDDVRPGASLVVYW